MKVTHGGCGTFSRRILVIDGNAAIHEDFRKIFRPARTGAAALSQPGNAFFGQPSEPHDRPQFLIDSAYQDQEGAALVRRAREENRPFAMAFVDAGRPPAWGGIETVARIWEHDPAVQIVLCAACSGDSWQEIRRRLGHSDRLVILRKPFDPIDVLQLTDVLTEKGRLARENQQHLQNLERRIGERHRDWQAMQSINAQLEAASGHPAPATQRDGETPDTGWQRHDELVRELQRALRAQELTLHYQPLVDIASRRVVGLEALLRWVHPTWGAVSPAEFIPAAEESGLIVPVGEFVLRSVCEQVVRWERQNVPVVPVSVNVSAVQLQRQELWEVVRDILRETGLQPHRLALELTESTFMKNAARHARVLQGLRGDGVRIHIDDFGTGYSSLSYLKHLPTDVLKIDRSFIRQLDTSSTDEAIVGAILAMTRSLGLQAVAEGVETPAQLEVLGRHGCQIAQGYYFCRPVPAEQCRELLLDLSQRSTFTETLRMRVIAPPRSASPLSVVADQRPQTAKPQCK